MDIPKIDGLIHVLRGQQVMLDADLAELYGVEVGQLKRQVRRNSERFPEDFLFMVTAQEHEILRCQIGILGWGRYSKYLPFAFTEHGVAMLSSVLKSSRAIQVNIAIMRVFVQLRQALTADTSLSARMQNAELAIIEHERELTEHAAHINEAFAAIRKLPN